MRSETTRPGRARPSAGPGRRGTATVAWLLAIALVALQGPPLARHPLTDDERDYLAGAMSLARDGTLAFALPPRGEVARPSAYREPLYPAVLSIAWRLAGAVPESIASVGSDDGAGARARATASWLHFALLLAGAGAAAGLARAAGGGAIAQAAAFLLAGSSPALRFYGGEFACENLAAPLVSAATLALVAARARESRGLFLVAGGLWSAAALARAAFAPIGLAALALLGLAALAGERTARRARLANVAWVALALALPCAAWMARNAAATGFAVLADRGGSQLYLRTELGETLARGEWRAAWLEWTPLEAAQARRRERYPASEIADWRQSGAGNYYLRTWRLRAELAEALGSPLAADRELRRRALTRIAAEPLAQLAAAPPIAWRGLFAERSPPRALPFDLRLALGLLLAAALAAGVLLALRRRDPALGLVALVALLAAALHALASEGLPRYGVPLLPILWALAAAVVARVWAERNSRRARA
ncbi:MAG: hypothetical protein U0X73_08195 [Thermoanaerobaculia bacterium]